MAHFIEGFNYIAPAISAVVAVGVGFFTFTLWRSTEMLWEGAESQGRHVEATALAAVAAQRPWLKVDLKITGDLEITEHGVRQRFNVLVWNSGNTPATQVQIWVTMCCGGFAVAYADAFNKIPLRAPSMMGFSIFPGESEFPEIYGGLTPEEVNLAMASTPMTNHISIGLVVLAYYKFAGGEGKTTKSYRLIGPHTLETVNVRMLPLLQNEITLKALDAQDYAT